MPQNESKCSKTLQMLQNAQKCSQSDPKTPKPQNPEGCFERLESAKIQSFFGTIK